VKKGDSKRDMITQIEIDGFKTFKDFKVELAPFQVIVGPNGSGKSNLFDALQLLSRLAELDLRTAVQELRGDVNELFMRLPGGELVDRMRFAVEMLVDRKVQDDLGAEAELTYTRLRYELEVTLGTDEYGLDQLHVTHESLKSIPQEKDRWSKKYELSAENKWVPLFSDNSVPFISTRARSAMIAEAAKPYGSDDPLTAPATNTTTIILHQDGQGAAKLSRADKIRRTVLSSVSGSDFPHAFAVNREMRSWKLLHLNPVELRRSSSIAAPPFLSPEGKNLPATLARIQAEDDLAFHLVYLNMANLVPGIIGLKIEKDQTHDQYTILVEMPDERLISSRALSDGTLRLLALATIRNDPQFHGVLCLEEPENGVDSQRLKDMAHLLHETATDFNHPEQADEALRQVLIATHSPELISLPEIIDSLLFAHKITRVEPLSSGQPFLEITEMLPVVTPHTQKRFSRYPDGDEILEAIIALDQVLRYLDSEDLDSARKQLEETRTIINEG
jgi:predicted ATPase